MCSFEMAASTAASSLVSGDDLGPLGTALKPGHYNQLECDLVNDIKPRCFGGLREPRGANTGCSNGIATC